MVQKESGKIRVATYIMSFLADRGVDCIFLLTGNGAMHLNDAIAQEPRLQYYCARNEASAPMMAESYARLTGKLGVVCVTGGPGGTNSVSGLAEAWVDSGPIMVISGQAPSDQLPSNDIARGVRSFGTAGIDIIPIVQSLTKYATTVTDPESIRYHLEKAYHLALTGRPGPVWIDLPMDIQYALVDPSELEGYAPDPTEQKLDTEVRQTLDLLEKSERPLIVGGQGLRQGGALDEFRQLVDRTGIPVVFSRLDQDILPSSHSQNLGHVGRRGVKYSKPLLARPDLILALGAGSPYPWPVRDWNISRKTRRSSWSISTREKLLTGTNGLRFRCAATSRLSSENSFHGLARRTSPIGARGSKSAPA